MGETELSRRLFLLGGAATGGLIADAVALDRASPDVPPIQGEVPWQAGSADAPPEATGTDYKFFTSAEVAFVEAAAARLIPGDANDPGAIEAGVPFFIDRQLAGPFGRGDHFFMQGPWPQGLPTQGYQSRMTPAKMYRAAIKAIDGAAGKRAPGKVFHDLSPADQDRLLGELEKGTVTLDDGVEAKAFFTLLLQNVKEGFFSDPIYGGNRNLVGWKMIGFPGAHYDYRDWVSRHGQRVPFVPVGIKGRPDWQEQS